MENVAKKRKSKEVSYDDIYDKIRRGDFWGLYLSDMRRKVLLKVNKETETGKLSPEKLVLQNLTLAVRMASKYKNSFPDILDLVQQGNLGLILAIENFDFTRDFPNYAKWYVRREITDELFRRSYMMGLSKRKREQLGRLRQTEDDLRQDLNRNPSDKETAKKMEVAIKKVRTLKAFRERSNILSLSDLVYSDADNRKGDFVANNDESPEERIMRIEKSDIWLIVSQLLGCNGDGRILKIISERNQGRNLQDILDELGITRNDRGVVNFTTPEKMFYVLARRSANNTSTNTRRRRTANDTLEEIGQDLGLTSSRIQQLEVEALECLRRRKRKKQLEQFR